MSLGCLINTALPSVIDDVFNINGDLYVTTSSDIRGFDNIQRLAVLINHFNDNVFDWNHLVTACFKMMSASA